MPRKPSSFSSALVSAARAASHLVQTHARVPKTSEQGGYPLLEHLRAIAGGPLVWAPGVGGAVLVSMRRGNFLFESGEDISAGYAGDNSEAVRLYLEESFRFRVARPEAAVALSG